MLSFISDIVLVRISLAGVMLLVASILDLRRREVNDAVWIMFGAIGIVLIFASPDPWSAAKSAGVAMIVAPVALVLWRFGMFGGADALCLMALAVLSPMTTLHGGVITPITTLTNASVVSIVPLFANLGRNLLSLCRKEDIFAGVSETRLNKTIAMFVGYRAKNPKYSFSMERTEGNQRKFSLGLHNAETSEFCTRKDMWVTPGIPYILYLAAGYAIQVFYGDIIFNLIKGLQVS